MYIVSSGKRNYGNRRPEYTFDDLAQAVELAKKKNKRVKHKCAVLELIGDAAERYLLPGLAGAIANSAFRMVWHPEGLPDNPQYYT